MKSIRELYKIGVGPSSSHTMGPARAAKLFREDTQKADHYRVELHGSLSKTGHGHKTDKAILNVLEPIPTDIIFCDDTGELLPHENTLDLYAYCQKNEIAHIRVLSVGGGDVEIVGYPLPVKADVYKENSFAKISEYCKSNKIRISEYVIRNEGLGIMDYMGDVWNTMRNAILTGLSTGGVLSGGLGVERKAQMLYNQRHMDESESTRENRIVCSYAFAVSEQNADGGIIVTAPTCGSCGVVPAVLAYMQDNKGFSDEEIKRALAVAGIIGNLAKENASISGAECGCQAEIGTACSMAAAALAELFEMGLDQIEYAAEVAMEHHLGLTCDPICGLVQIPCIERNAVAAMRAINAAALANFLTFTRKISFDLVLKTMYETGKDMSSHYRETSDGGLAKLYR